MKRQRQVWLVALSVAVLAMLVMTGCSSSASTGGSSTAPAGTSSSGGGATGGTTITEQNFAFSPSTATVKTGDTVTFTNKDSAPHNVTIDGQQLGNQNQGESKTWTASKDGTYPFSCIIHPSMTGQITVGSGGGSTAPPSGSTGGGSAPPPSTGYSY